MDKALEESKKHSTYEDDKANLDINIGSNKNCVNVLKKLTAQDRQRVEIFKKISTS